MAISNDILMRALTGLGVVPAGPLEAACRSADGCGRPLAALLIERGLIDEGTLGQLVTGLESMPDEAFPSILREAERASGEPSIPDVIGALLLDAHRSGAAEVHLEPRENGGQARFLIDGILHDVIRPSRRMHDMIVGHMKALGRLHVDEDCAAQAGRISLVADGTLVEARLDVVPVMDGEKAVVRLSPAGDSRFRMESLGLSADGAAKLARAVRKPSGMILVAGPAGSGKTSTLYAILESLGTSKTDIVAVEDPIEGDIAGISQVQVDSGAGITFASGLRAIARRNPDTVLIGEILDEETAAVAFGPFMSGRRLFSALRADDAASALVRLLRLQVDPSSVVASVNVVLAQRLVRRICPKCRKESAFSLTEARAAGLPSAMCGRLFDGKDSVTLHVGAKCAACRHTGHAGRIGLFEALEMDEELGALLMRRAGVEEIRRMAVRQGMTTMLEDGIRKVLDGQTTLDELLRVMRD